MPLFFLPKANVFLYVCLYNLAIRFMHALLLIAFVSVYRIQRNRSECWWGTKIRNYKFVDTWKSLPLVQV